MTKNKQPERRSIEKYKLSITVATAILILLFVITTSTMWASWKAETENKINYNNMRCDLLTEKQK